jgi:hypothetical protein
VRRTRPPADRWDFAATSGSGAVAQGAGTAR